MNKTYPRLPEIILPLPKKNKKSSLEIVFSKRTSRREFSTKPLALRQLSKILFYGCGMNNRKIDDKISYRIYPSAGAKFPIEVYPIILNCKGVTSGIYHYNVANHLLEQLLIPLEEHHREKLKTMQAWYENAAVIFVLTSVFSRTTQKYGNKGIGFSLIESGFIGQSIYLLSEELNLGCCALGELKEQKLVELLEINIELEIPIYALVVGNLK